MVLAASPRAAVLWRRRTADHRALWAVPIGHDVVVDVAGFSMHGRSKRNLRQAVQRAHNAGLTTTVLPEADIDAALRAELLGVARNSGKSIDAERGFSMMLDGTLTGRYPGTWLVVARNRAGAVQGFQRYATAGGGAEVSLDLPWRRADAPNGTDERLTVDMIDWAKAHGGRRLSLAFAPFPDIFATEPDGVVRQTIRAVLRALDGFIKLESLYRYVCKYESLGRRRYVLLTPVDVRAPLDVCIVRKPGAPGHGEFAIGALAHGGRVVLNDDAVLPQLISSRMSSAVKAAPNTSPSSITEENSAALRALSATTFSSMVSRAMSRYTITFRVCPIRCVRSTAWASTAGFHHGSSRKQ